MFKKSLFIALALLILPFSLVVSTGTATAATETDASLKGRLLSNTELKDAMTAAGSKTEFNAGKDMDALNIDGLVSAGRVWEAKDGAVLVTALLSPKDGSAITSKDKNDILGDEFASGVMSGFFDSYKLVENVGEILDSNDVGHQFSGKTDGKTYDVFSITFVRGNIFGITYYSTLKTNEGTETGASFGAQTVKLPKN